jgi:peroxin-5
MMFLLKVNLLASDWDSAFRAQESSVRTDATATHESITARPTSPQLQTDEDALARTAGELLSSVSSATNPKFASSTFMDLMRKLRDHEVAVEGDKVVEQIQPTVERERDLKGKGREVDPSSSAFASSANPQQQQRPVAGAFPQNQWSSNTDEPHPVFSYRELAERYVQTAYDDVKDIWNDEDRVRAERENVQNSGDARGVRRVQFQGDGGAVVEDDQDFDNDDLLNGPQARPGVDSTRMSEQEHEWSHLQQEWDDWEATSTGVQPVASTSQAPPVSEHSASGYRFTPRNPYLYDVEGARVLSPYADPSFATRQQGQSSLVYESILQKEAVVQVHPHDPKAWLALGIKQQENEREDMAIRALLQATELDANLAEPWLALAVSYTNEGARGQAYHAIQRWITCQPDYADAVRDWSEPIDFDEGLLDLHSRLTNMLIGMARSRADVDPDVQVALGVLFNSSDEFEKAADCFAAALSVRPDVRTHFSVGSIVFGQLISYSLQDPSLLNRFGATLANSGRSEEALEYYAKALELQSDYVRAKYNLSVSRTFSSCVYSPHPRLGDLLSPFLFLFPQ